MIYSFTDVENVTMELSAHIGNPIKYKRQIKFIGTLFVRDYYSFKVKDYQFLDLSDWIDEDNEIIEEILNTHMDEWAVAFDKLDVQERYIAIK